MPGKSSRRLAIDGGEPAFPAGPPNWPLTDDAVRESIERVIADGNWGRYLGPYHERLAERLAEMHGTSHVHLCSSGTIAVELALRGLKVGEGDEVVVAAYDFPGNFRSIEAVGARPVLVDLLPGEWTVGVEAVEQALSPEVKAILVSHLHGSLADMRALRRLADERGLAIVEDACQASGARVQGRPAGCWGDCGVLSFGGSKLLTAGRGGAVLTSRADIAQRIRIFADRGNDAFPLSQLQAAALLPQLDSLDARNATRLENVQRLLRSLPPSTGLAADRSLRQVVGPTVAEANGESSRPAFYKLGWLLDLQRNNASGADDRFDNRPPMDLDRRREARRWLIAALRAEGIAIDEGFRGFAGRSTSRCRSADSLEQAAFAAAATIILHHPALLESPEYIDKLARTMVEVAEQLPERLLRAPAADQ